MARILAVCSKYSYNVKARILSICSTYSFNDIATNTYAYSK